MIDTINRHWLETGLQNHCSALYITFRRKGLFRFKKEVKMRASGQLNHPALIADFAAEHLYVHGMAQKWEFFSWRVEMYGKPAPGYSDHGKPPADFDIKPYILSAIKRHEQFKSLSGRR